MTASAGPALQRLHRAFGDKIEFLSVYVREAHPGERYPQPEAIDRKQHYARDYATRDRIPWTVAVDDIEGSFHQLMGSGFNSAWLVDETGTIVFRSLTAADEAGLSRALEAVADLRRPETLERSARVVPLLRAIGELEPTLQLAGDEAERHVKQAFWPAWALGRWASAFTPMPPLARGLAAVLTTFAGATLLGLAVRRRFASSNR